MFVLCPHCQFLVALSPATGQAPADCPRCGHPLQPPTAHRPDPTAVAGTESVRDDRPPRAATTPVEVAAAPDPPPHDPGREAPSPSPPPSPPPPPPPASRPPSARRARRAGAAIDAGTHDTPAPASITAEPAGADPASATRAAPAAPSIAAVDADAGGPGPATDVPPAAPASPPDIAHATSPAQTPVAQADDDATQAATAAVRDDAALPNAMPLPGDTPPVITDAAAPAAEVVAPTRRQLPSFAHPLQHAPAARPDRSTIALIAGLALLLMLQLLLADRARLATDARWRPLLSALCGALQCRLPAWHEPAAFTLLARDVRPARRGVLRVSASFRNDARWPQPWPALHLALQDVDGRTVGARTLRPEEYQEPDHARVTQSGLAPGQSVHVAFDIIEPAATVVAFTFDFR